MRRYLISWVDENGKVWMVGGPNGIEAVSIKAAAQMFWAMWTGRKMPVKVTIEEVK